MALKSSINLAKDIKKRSSNRNESLSTLKFATSLECLFEAIIDYEIELNNKGKDCSILLRLKKYFSSLDLRDFAHRSSSISKASKTSYFVVT